MHTMQYKYKYYLKNVNKTMFIEQNKYNFSKTQELISVSCHIMYFIL